MRRAKIVCTLGPATDSEETMAKLIRSGMSVARLNLSHGTQADHQARLDLVRRSARDAGVGVAVLADLQGPKIRLGTFVDERVDLMQGQRFTITTRDVPGDAQTCSTTYGNLTHDVRVGDEVLIDDGNVTLRAVEVGATEVVCEVLVGGRVSNNKGINLPGVIVSVPALSEKDIDDLRWALNADVDMVALSFVQRPEDIDDVRRIMDEQGVHRPILAKIEKPQAVDHLSAIIETFDGIMVARGDLGVELPLEQVPLVQKRAIELSRAAAKPVIVATQMLDSMVTSSRPTRAEASDVANAVLDGTDALMLSGETSVGDHPDLVVSTMARIIEYVEEKALGTLSESADNRTGSTARAITRAATEVAEEVDAKFIISFTETGLTPRLVARHRSRIPILCFTPTAHVRNYLALVWGITPFDGKKVHHTDELVEDVDLRISQMSLAAPGDKVVVIAGVPPGVPGTTNGMRVHLVGSGSAGRAEGAEVAEQV
ncbi:MAG: pyruvate kinase [Actinobacteria bacterium]|nr:pyruvate kinase [Actinomycetota bacterium]MCB9428273.1 pyruvate kinase [Actinomycetota bacterium]HPE12399.1 pyruvate kinase [Actinomycetota bacterium]HPQ84009.1 pyruvate kinase [Actinomycetota bacterium]HRV64949.1 pyruvate kinase [Candidatus Nanopelagicales bacterium]